MHKDEIFATFWEHLEELRRTFLRIFLIIIFSTILCFSNHELILSILTKPFTSSQVSSNDEHLTYFRIYNSEPITKKIDPPKNYLIFDSLSENTQYEEGSYLIFPGGSLVYAKTKPAQELILLSPLEGILFSLKSSFWTGIFISSPFWLYILSRFFLPGLKREEKNLIFPFIGVSLIFILIGCLFAYCITIPIANHYLINFNQTIGVNLWSLGNYLDYTLFLIMANGLAFELGVLGVFAVHLQMLNAEMLKKNRRIAIVGAFIVSAILTPPDILTLFLLAIPLIGLYEGIIVYATLRFSAEKTNLT